MGSGHTLNPNGGVLFRRGLENRHKSSLPGYDPISFLKRPVRTRKPWCCGEGERETPPYPIICF